MPNSTNDVREAAAQIVKELGQTTLPNGKSLREQLTIEGVSLWDVMTPSMALYYVPKSLALGPEQSTPLMMMRPHLTLLKHRLLNSITKTRNFISNHNEGLQRSPYIFMGFNTYMYNDVLAPLVKVLSGENGAQSIVLSDGVAPTGKNQNLQNVQFQSTWQYWDAEVSREAKIFKKKTGKSVTELRNFFKASDFSFNSGNSQKIIDHAFNWLLNFDLPLLITQVVLARRLIRICKPILLISPDVADIRSRVFTLVAMRENIPALELQYGSCEENSYEWKFLLAEHIAVWGEQSRQNLLKQGVPDSQMTTIGTPRHDYVANIDQLSLKKIKSKLRITNSSAVVLFASSYQQKEYESFSHPDLIGSMKKAIFNAANKAPGLLLVVKPHPLEDVDETRGFLASEENIVFAPPTADIRDLIAVCDVFIGLGTTATIDAMVAEKLIICPVFGDWIWSDWLARSNAVLVPRSESEIAEIFASILDGRGAELKSNLQSNQDSYIANMLYKSDGSSSKRIAYLAMKLARKY